MMRMVAFVQKVSLIIRYIGTIQQMPFMVFQPNKRMLPLSFMTPPLPARLSAILSTCLVPHNKSSVWAGRFNSLICVNTSTSCYALQCWYASTGCSPQFPAPEFDTVRGNTRPGVAS